MEAALMLIHAVTDAATEAGDCTQQGNLHVVKPALLQVETDHADPDIRASAVNCPFNDMSLEGLFMIISGCHL